QHGVCTVTETRRAHEVRKLLAPMLSPRRRLARFGDGDHGVAKQTRLFLLHAGQNVLGNADLVLVRVQITAAAHRVGDRDHLEVVDDDEGTPGTGMRLQRVHLTQDAGGADPAEALAIKYTNAMAVLRDPGVGGLQAFLLVGIEERTTTATQVLV